MSTQNESKAARKVRCGHFGFFCATKCGGCGAVFEVKATKNEIPYICGNEGKSCKPFCGGCGKQIKLNSAQETS